jgi:hypothetical protein
MVPGFFLPEKRHLWQRFGQKKYRVAQRCGFLPFRGATVRDRRSLATAIPPLVAAFRAEKMPSRAAMRVFAFQGRDRKGSPELGNGNPATCGSVSGRKNTESRSDAGRKYAPAQAEMRRRRCVAKHAEAGRNGNELRRIDVQQQRQTELQPETDQAPKNNLSTDA